MKIRDTFVGKLGSLLTRLAGLTICVLVWYYVFTANYTSDDMNAMAFGLCVFLILTIVMIIEVVTKFLILIHHKYDNRTIRKKTIR